MEEDYNKLISYIKQILKGSYVEVKVARQIREYKKNYNYTYSGMLKTLIYCVEVKHMNLADKAHGGIGIIPYCYQEARDYFYNLYLIQQQQQHQKIEYKYQSITILPPKVERQMNNKLFNLEKEVEE